MIALLEKLLARAPGWAIGIVLIIIAGGWVWTQVQAHRADKVREQLWNGYIGMQKTVDNHAAAATNPSVRPEYVEENQPSDWAPEKK